MKRRLIAVFAAIFMLFSAAVCAWAAEAPAGEASKEPVVWKIPTAGMDITLPEKWTESGRYFSYKDYDFMEGVRMNLVVMYDASSEEMEAAAEEFSEEEDKFVDWLEERVNDLVYLVSIRDSVGADAFLEETAQNMEKTVEEMGIVLNELGKADGWTFYEIKGVEEIMFRRPTPIQGTEEAVAMVFDGLPEMLENITFYAPIPEPKIEEGTRISFKTVDFEGKEVDSADLFAKNKYTMINLWMSWCTYCVEEMPELEVMNKEFEKDGCGIIGVMLDGDEEKKLQVGKDVAASAGVTYPLLIANDQMKEQLIAPGYPTTVFVDSEGMVIGESIIGMDVPGYRERMAALLSGEFGKQDEEDAAEDAADAGSDEKVPAGYIVKVQDEDGKPVEDVSVQFCSDRKCMMDSTDEDGIASFDAPGGKYTIHIVEVPDGFAEDAREYETPEVPGTVVITLKK